MKLRMLTAALSLSCLFHAGAAAAGNEPVDANPGKVVVSGTVPDEASRAALLGRLRDIYGAANIVDRLEVGGVVPPPNWTEYMAKMLTPGLKQVHKGQLHINGTQVAIRGNVENEAVRQQVASDMATALNPTYSIDNALAVAVAPQRRIDDTLSNRTIEFELGSAALTPRGQALLDEILVVIKDLGSPRLQIIGHTDNSGNRMSNVGLSLARAGSVRDYLIKHGVPADTLSALGSGPDHPIASNNTAEGRAKNRRIQFRLVNN